MLYLGIDSGTQSTKCVIVDVTTGEILASSQEAYGLIPGLPQGHLEQDPQDWLDAVSATIRDCTNQLGVRAQEVRGIGVSAQQHGLVVLDAEGQCIRPAKLWCDTSTEAQCREIAEAFGGHPGLARAAGNPMLPGYTASKILWLKQLEPANYARVAHILLPHDYINYWLTGAFTMEYGDASGTGLLDIRTRQWHEGLLNFIGPEVRAALPEVGSSHRAAGELRKDLADQLGLPPGILVSAGGGDNMMGAIGTGNTAPGGLTVSLGTSGTLYAFSPTAPCDPTGEAAIFCDSTDHWLPLICTMNVSVAIQQIMKMLAWDQRDMQRNIMATPPGAEGLVFLPYLNGERTPNLPSGTGVFHGLTTANMQAGHLARAVVEGVTLGLAYGLTHFTGMGLPAPTELRATGGGSRSPLWRQMLADMMNVQLVAMSTPEGAALGAALQAAWTSGEAGTLSDLIQRNVMVDDATRVTPDPTNHALYADLLARQTNLMRNLHGAGYL